MCTLSPRFLLIKVNKEHMCTFVSERGLSVTSPSPDDDVFEHLARTYASTHAYMSDGNFCGDFFEDGITNGAEWYAVTGAKPTKEISVFFFKFLCPSNAEMFPF